MKIKAYSESIFTINTSLDKFDKNIILKKSSFKYSLGKYEDEDKLDTINIEYCPYTISKLKYLYHIKKIGAGMVYEHLGYAKLTLSQHLILLFTNRLIPWVLNLENMLKIVTLIALFTSSLIGYKQIELSKSQTPIIIKYEYKNLNK